ncbi:hypothetical protein L202_05529 [Cryptococcus amylolentus CBS 6039]|uniref:Uncharacterized protein n=1 Tax=Cryptococcus amylolentus CBS 6039 TaxID=1295533 RepID=A0A1E3HML6_9TREE|nr:hypothetical protein L202_05529 [Cryptococcus amylolentus CBS 6039]ODN76966.1 hypothetical protein L202_05529 [Cryptococcus amylolentus CBS 6039]
MPPSHYASPAVPLPPHQHQAKGYHASTLPSSHSPHHAAGSLSSSGTATSTNISPHFGHHYEPPGHFFLNSHHTQNKAWPNLPSSSHAHHRRHRDDHFEEIPYHMLTVAIGRASSLGLRDVLRQAAANRKALGKNRFETRPNLQLRRSSKSGGDLLERQDNLPSPFKPLTFDSHALLTTPPLPPVDHIRHPPRDGDFFAGFAPPTESLGEDFRPDGIPRSSSAPSVPLLAMERRKSDASEPSALPGDNSAVSGARPSSYHHNDDSFNNRGGVIFDGSEPREFTSSPRSSSSVQSQHQTIAASRRATVKARNLSDQIHTTPRHHRLHQVIPDASDLSSYLGPELSAALQKRMMESGSSSLSGAGGSGGEARLKGLSDKVSPRLELEVTSGGLGGSSIALGSRGKQKEHVTESEWSFEVPILEVMSQAIKGKMELLEVKEHYHLAE